MKKIFIIGGTGNLSKHTVDCLLDRNFEIALFTRNKPEEYPFDKPVRWYFGNRDNTPDLSDAIRDFCPSIVIDFVCYTPLQAKNIILLVEEKLEQFIFISTVDVYGYPLSRVPFHESDKWNPTNGPYASAKLKCERIFNHVANRGKLPLTIMRPAYSFGNNFVLTPLSRGGGKHLIPWLRAQKPVLLLDGGKTLLHTSIAINTGKMIAQVAGKNYAIGNHYTCGHYKSITHEEYINIFANLLGVEPNIVTVPSETLIETGHRQLSKTILSALTRFDISFSIEKFMKDFPEFDFEATYEKAAKDYIDYNDQHNFFIHPSTTIFEDLVVEASKRNTLKFTIEDREYLFIE